ncbi:2-succinyl-5-enolpyruvyl-6-hydroxy-3-cyclohexene-1-carboxylic-acid synthase [Rubrobacter tropicus]|uniref:2-succinyl-5-enolpyruvyl-6-hydroxy-3-cyclohexene-1-carboxylate synthase n=1 Tax=Rubrobacter tropicus TaxID=2653851 RepID=A0A6G8QC02_9ACTN|nr:2-succinyl-5-enolpyruvyl-6-hydroxy-3-cyclohexene-1-carboxylic-acid synthase [Rubrobacter tropicus]QIN84020.1 2-succinyl-5-enolpyruvyl-6-hydroxy-3-cyclohexene-1-carboxylic-acid synthase [Rubrobacter tropicus]
METPRANRLWAHLVVEELLRCGVGLFCVAPGSRSTPLVAALAANKKAESLVHFDERGTAFAALGYARATGLPAAWITTSGTAVANGLPAVVEAATDGVPMILLTADRPPELRQTGANQTIDQPDIFGDFVRWRFDLPAPSLDVDPASVLTTVDQAAYRALRAPSGPVHLNLMFREPLIPDPEEDDELPSGPDRWREKDGPYTRYAATKPAVDGAEIRALWHELRPVERGLVVAGRLASREQGEAVEKLALALGWPLLPDVGSQVRLGGGLGNVAFYDALLADEAFAGGHAPEAVLHVGGRALSKRLEGFVARVRPDPYVVVRENPFRLDPGHGVTHSVESDVVGFCAALVRAADDAPSFADPSWAEGWRAASNRAGAALDRSFAGGRGLDEPLVARLVSKEVPEGHGLVVASSMPIRDLDAYAAAEGVGVPVAANRGASGIDGTVATAAGFARGSGGPVTLLMGDLALLHDLNSLAMLRGLPVTVVVLNNDGGGIFSFLPVSRHRDFFEPYFGTPQGVGFESAAAMFGLDYARPQTAEEFLTAYLASLSGDGPALIEVRTDRAGNVTTHQELLREVSAAIREG